MKQPITKKVLPIYLIFSILLLSYSFLPWIKPCQSNAEMYCVPVTKKMLAVPLHGQLTLWPDPNRAKVGCGVTSAYMAIEYYINKKGKAVDSKYLEIDYVFNNYLKNEAATRQYFKDALSGLANIKGGDIKIDAATIKEEIDSGNPIVIYTGIKQDKENPDGISTLTTGHHIIIITGYIKNSYGTVQTIIFNDPMAPSTTRKLSISDFNERLIYHDVGKKFPRYFYADF